MKTIGRFVLVLGLFILSFSVSYSNSSGICQQIPEFPYYAGYSDEERESFVFAYMNGLTTMGDIKKANMNGLMTRAAMAKMLSQYAINILGKTPDYSKKINFIDVTNELDRQYGNGITLAYQLGIMGQGTNKFRPYSMVSRAEFATALSRLLYGMSDGRGSQKYYEPHLARLYNEGIINNTNPNIQEKRGYVMIMLMRSSGWKPCDSGDSNSTIIEPEINNQTGNNNTTTGNGGDETLMTQTDACWFSSFSGVYIYQETNDAYNISYKRGIVKEPLIIDEFGYASDDLGLHCRVTRAEAAKMLVAFARHKGKPVDTSRNCSFSDINSVSVDTQSAIIELCQMGLIGEDVDKFRPDDFITQGELSISLSRILWGDKYDGGSHPSYNHMKALKGALIWANDLCSPESIEYGADCKPVKEQILIMISHGFDQKDWIDCDEPILVSVCSEPGSDAYKNCPAICRTN